MTSRALRWFMGLLGAVVFLAAVLLSTLVLLSRSTWGMERARRVALSWAKSQVQGVITVERISGDGLLHSLDLHSVSIVDPTGRAFVRADSLSARYDLLDLLVGRIVLRSVTVWNGVVDVERFPGDTLWNYQRILAHDGGSGPERVIRFRNVTLVNNRVNIIRPLTEDPAAGGMAARYVIEDAPGGRVQLIHVDSIEGHIPSIAWSKPGSDVHEIDIGRLAARVQFLRDPFSVHDVAGSVTLQDSIIDLEVRNFALAASHGRANGRVTAGSAGMRYNLRIDTPELAVSDLLWLDERLPADAHARGTWRVLTQPDGNLLLSGSEMTVDAPRTHVTGSFGWITGAQPALRDVDLRMAPLDLAWADAVWPDSIPLRGLLSGRVQAKGPLGAVQTTGEIQLAQWGGAALPVLSWNGTICLGDAIELRNLTANFSDVDLALLERLRPGLGVEGLVDGRVDAAGAIASGVQLHALVRHRLNGFTSELNVTGDAAADNDVISMNLRVDASPLRLESLGRMVPRLDSLRGEVRGRLALTGRADSLQLDGDVTTQGGPLSFSTLIDRHGATPHIVARGHSTRFDPSRIGLLDTPALLSGQATLDLTGEDLASYSGPVRVELDSATIHDLRLEYSFAELHLRAGSAHVDSAVIRSPGLRATATGGFGLVAERNDSLRIALNGQSFEPLERVLFNTVKDPTTPRINGSGSARIGLYGSLAAFDATVDARLDHPFYDGRSATSAVVTGSARGVRTDSLAYTLAVSADSVRAFGELTDSVRAALSRSAGSGRLSADAWRRDTSLVHIDGSFADSAGVTSVRVAQLRFRSGPGEWRLSSAANIRIEGRAAHVAELRLIPTLGGSVAARGTLAWANESTDPELDFTAELQQVPFGLIPQMLRPRGDITGMIGGTIRVAGTATAPTFDARFDLADIAYQGAQLQRVQLALGYSNQLVNARASAFVAGRRVLDGQGAIPADLRLGATTDRLPDKPLDFKVRMDSFPAAFMLSISRGFSDVRGVFVGTVDGSGTMQHAQLSGALVLLNGAATWDATGVRYVSGEGTFLMNKQLEASVDFTARTVDPRSANRSGTARLTGTLDLTHPTDPGFDLAVQADRILAARRRDMDVTASGRVTIGGRYSQPLLAGDIRVDGGTLNLDELYRQYLIVQLEDPLFFDVVDTSLVSVRRIMPQSESPFLKNVRIGTDGNTARVTVGPGSWLRSSVMNVEVTGDFTVVFDRTGGDRADDDLRMNGSLRVVRGTYRLQYPPFTRVFEVREGTVEFPGTPGMDPNLNITAAYTARTGGEPLDIYADVTGTLQSPRVRLSSDAQPPIGESDLASYLFFGAPTYAFNFSSGNGSVIGNLGQQLLANQGLGYVASGLQTLGQSFGLVDYVGLTAAEAAPNGRGDSGLGSLLSTTKIEVGRYFPHHVFVTWTQRLNSQGNRPGVNIEWRFRPTYGLEGFWEDRFARTPSFSLSQAITTRVLGLSIFREWGY